MTPKPDAIPITPIVAGEPDGLLNENRLYRVVAERIKGLIAVQNLRPGDRLPSERDLAAQLHVSRTSVREAVIVLDLTNVVEVRGGSGIYVSEGARIPDESEAGPGPFEVLAARKMIESEVAATAARMATPKAIDAMLAALQDMERYYDDRERNEEADRAFHVAIANATGNNAIAGVIDYLWEQRGRLWSRMEHHFHTEELRSSTIADHRAILEAIASHDPAGARRAMRSHLERVTRQFARGWGLKEPGGAADD
ncbi:MAG: FadR family transcriptional regulator [Burkholderiales bacterium]|nr:FadR family transcriptional regulator [Burkholderiales bacterium]